MNGLLPIKNIDSKSIAKALKGIISLDFLLLFIIPISYSFGPADRSDMNSQFGWNPDYFYADEIFLIFLSPFYVLWVIYLINRNKMIKSVLTFLLIAISVFYSFICALSASTLAQDLQPYWGLLVLFLFFPLLVSFFIIERKAFQLNLNIELNDEIILDEDNL